jgi:hypothetical protein
MQVTNMQIWDLINTVRSPKFIKEYKNTYGGKQVLFNPDPKFTGLPDLESIDTILNKPIQHNEERIINTKTFDVICSTAGSFVNMDAYLSGEPENMYQFENSDANIVEDLNLFIALTYKVKATEIQKAADRIYKYVIMRPANVSLNINLRSDYTHSASKETHSLILNLASAEDYLTDQVINLIGSSMLYRYFILSYRFCIHNSTTWPAQMPEGYINFMTFDKTWNK